MWCNLLYRYVFTTWCIILFVIKGVNMKLQLVYQRIKNMSCISHPHYDLCTVEKDPKNIACILSGGKESNKILKKMVKLYNKENK